MASRIDLLAEGYATQVNFAWDRWLSSSERVWFAVYPSEDERRLRYKLDAFQLATAAAGKRWILVDLTHWFSRWLDLEEDRDRLLADPESLYPLTDEFLAFVTEEVVMAAQEADADTVIAILGAASLYGFAQVSDLVPRVAERLSGRLLVFFPGSREGNVYKLLDAREGWNYLATSISPHDGKNS
jgi:hypothetical protein